MNITCEKCQTVFALEDSLVRTEGIRVRCSECRHVFRVSPPETHSDDSPTFKILKETHCPLYKVGDEFRLSENIFLSPYNKPPCLILVKDLMQILNESPEIQGPLINDAAPLLRCSGCTGRIEFQQKNPYADSDDHTDVIATLLNKFPLFHGLNMSELTDITYYLQLERFEKDDFILRKGAFGNNLFIIVSGTVEVLNDDGISIAAMGKGEVFGEMSLFSGAPVGATVKAAELAAVLRMGSKNFKRILDKYPPLQMNMIRLLVQRMAEINVARSEEFRSGVTGKLSEMPPSDLFQTFNMNQKTGVLTLKLHQKSAYLAFREGKLVKVKYSNIEGEEAFFELLKQKEGRFKYIPGLPPEEMNADKLGDFMSLLIEGLRRIDEDDRQFLCTVIPTLI